MSDNLFSEKQSSEISPIGIINEPVDLTIFGNHFSHSSYTKKLDEPIILPLIVLTTEACPFCLNNVVEYATLFEKEPMFYEPILVFVKEKKLDVERFIAISDLNIPYRLVNSKTATRIIRNSKQNLLFVNPNDYIAFYNIEIPDVETPLEYKEEQLQEAFKLWKSQYSNSYTLSE